MDKRVIVILSSVLAVIAIFVLVNSHSKDALKFKLEYESLNGQTNQNGKEYVEVSIDKDNPFIYATYDEVIDLLKKGTGVIYFGFPECPWCRNMVPVLVDSAKEVGVKKIYYFNALDMRDIKKLDDDGQIITEKKGTEEYYKLIDLLSDYLTPYEGLNDDTIKRLYFPTVVFVKNGKIISTHIGTLDSQKDPYIKLTKAQKQELKGIYTDQMSIVFDIACDDAC